MSELKSYPTTQSTTTKSNSSIRDGSSNLNVVAVVVVVIKNCTDHDEPKALVHRTLTLFKLFHTADIIEDRNFF
jgi:hypothetical protein